MGERKLTEKISVETAILCMTMNRLGKQKYSPTESRGIYSNTLWKWQWGDFLVSRFLNGTLDGAYQLSDDIKTAVVMVDRWYLCRLSVGLRIFGFFWLRANAAAAAVAAAADCGRT